MLSTCIYNTDYIMVNSQYIMQKPQQKQSHSRSCQLCRAQVHSQLYLTDVANYSEESHNLTIVPKYACKMCRDQILTIRSFVEDNGLCFGKDSAIGREIISQIGGFAIDKRKDKGVASQLYSHLIEQQIKRQKLHKCSKMPSNTLQLVYYSSLSINHAQRHQRIRNIIGQIMQAIPIPYQNLQDMATLVNVLMCFFAEGTLVWLIRIVGEKAVLDGDPWRQSQVLGNSRGKELNDFKEEDQQSMNNIWKNLYKCGYIGNIAVLIIVLIRNWSNSLQVYQKIKAYQGYIKPSQIAQVIGQPSEPVSPYSGISSTLCKQCQRYKQQFGLVQAKFRNILSLILSTVLKEDAAQRQHMTQIQAKFAREKEEFINKIIKLKDKIEVLEHHQNQGLEFRRARSVSESHTNTKYKRELDVVSQKSEGTTKTVQQSKDKIDENVRTLETDKQKQQDKDNSLVYLQQLVSQLPEFEPSMLSSDADPKNLTEILSSSIKSLSQQVQALTVKNRHLESQSKRLLSILTRKEERFVPLIHEKDEIIDKYENALWRMQHGLLVQDPALAPRIQNIINVFKNQFMESLSNGTLDMQIERGSERLGQELATPVKENSSSSKKNKAKQKQKVKNKTDGKVRGGDKECLIF